MPSFASNTVSCLTSSTRARHLASVAGGLLLAALTAAPALADVAPPILPGLPWRSGATVGAFPCLAQLRGRALDAVNTFVPPNQGFAGMVTFTAGSFWRAQARKAPLAVVSLPLLTLDTQGQFAQCAAGAFDRPFRQIGANLKAAGAQGTVVRLGWEANIRSKSHPWGVDGPDQVGDYVQCWRHAALALKAGGPGLNLEWTSAKKTANTALHVLDLYPGDDAVDLWGVHYYDGGPL